MALLSKNICRENDILTKKASTAEYKIAEYIEREITLALSRHSICHEKQHFPSFYFVLCAEFSLHIMIKPTECLISIF